MALQGRFYPPPLERCSVFTCSGVLFLCCSVSARTKRIRNPCPVLPHLTPPFSARSWCRYCYEDVVLYSHTRNQPPSPPQQTKKMCPNIHDVSRKMRRGKNTHTKQTQNSPFSTAACNIFSAFDVSFPFFRPEHDVECCFFVPIMGKHSFSVYLLLKPFFAHLKLETINLNQHFF